LVLVLFGSLVFQPQASQAAPIGTFTVDVMTDLSGSNDAVPGDGYCLTSGGDCTLRAAIQEANAMPGENTIIFDPGVTTVILQSALPPLSDTSGGTKIYGGELYVYIQGTLAGSSTNGFVLDSNYNKIQGLDIVDFGGNGIVINGDNNTIGTEGDGVSDSAEDNVIRENSQNGIQINFGADNNRVSGNRIGVDRSGAAKANIMNGIQLGGNSNRIGVVGDGISDTVEGNIISRNEQNGIDVTGSSNTISGNTITTNTKNGIYFYGCNLNLIGTNGNGIADAAEGNLISGNLDYGIQIYLANEITMAGNKIGTNAAGDARFANMDGGIYIWDGYANVIGSDGAGSGAAAEGNLISGNNNHGVKLYISEGTTIAGNKIGTNLSGSAALYNGNAGIYFDRSQFNIIGTNGNGVGDTLEGNLISGNGGDGIDIVGIGSIDNVIAGNIIGLDASGLLALPNEDHGLLLGPNGDQNLVGTDGNGISDAQERNIISGNTLCGVYVRGAQNTVAGNYIGTNINGNAALPNQTYGVCIIDAMTNMIGSNGDGVGDSREGNVISGNGYGGIHIGTTGITTAANTIFGNWIGTTASGAGALGNNGAGVWLENVGDNRVGYSTSTLANVIAHNVSAGISFTSLGNVTGNQLVGNRMYANLFGIDLGSYGVTYNDTGDYDSGANSLLNFPVLLGAESTGDSLSVAVSYSSAPNKNYALDFYWSSACNASGYGEGELYLGWDSLTTDAGGAALKQVGLAVDNIQPGFITATAMDADGSTSEFSACIPVEGATYTIMLPLIVR
jgi:parallel beta-helix repeat protein